MKQLGCPRTRWKSFTSEINIEKFNKRSVWISVSISFGIHHYVETHGYTMKKLETSSMSPYPDTAILYQLQIITTFKVDTRYSRLYKVKFIIKVKEWYGPVVLELMIVRLYDLQKTCLSHCKRCQNTFIGQN